MTHQELVREIKRREITRQLNLVNSPIVGEVAQFLCQTPDIAAAMAEDRLGPPLEVADRMPKAFASPRETTQTRTSQRLDWSKESAHDQLTSDYLLELITPWVRAIRKLIFGSKVAPFKEFDEAMYWLNEQLHGGGKVANSMFIDGEARQISEITNFSIFSVTEYILLDWPPILPKFYVEGQCKVHEVPFARKSIRNAWLSVHIFSDLSFNDLRQMYKAMRDYLGIRQSKTFNEKNLKLYEMVLEEGGPPTRGVVYFWESIRRKWNKKHEDNPDETYESWKGVEKAYVGIVERLSFKYDVGKERVKEFELGNEFEKPQVLERDPWLRTETRRMFEKMSKRRVVEGKEIRTEGKSNEEGQAKRR